MTFPESDSKWQRDGDATGLRRFFSKRMLIMLAVILGLLTLVFGFIIGKQMFVSHMMATMVQVTTVATTHAKPTPWQSELKAVGTMHAIDGADLSAEVAGIVTRIGFEPARTSRKARC